MKILKYLIPAVILNKLYKGKYSANLEELTPEEEDLISDFKDDKE